MGQLKKTLFGFAALVAVVMVVFYLVNNSGDKSINKRKVAELQVGVDSENVETPPGHTYEETEKLWHLSEGADIMPLRWFLYLKSVTSKKSWINNGEASGYLYEDLEHKYGVIETNSIVDVDDDYDYYKQKYSNPKGWTSPMKWVGLTLASSEPPNSLQEEVDYTIPAGQKPSTDQQAFEVLAAIDRDGYTDISGQNSKFGGQIKIPMVGTNCAFCHSGKARFNKGSHSTFIEGAPNMINTRGFFQDLSGAALAAMLQPPRLKEFLTKLQNEGLLGLKDHDYAFGGGPGGRQQGTTTPEQQIEIIANNFVRSFKKSLWGVPEGETTVGKLVDWETWRFMLIGKDSKDVVLEALDRPVNKGKLAEGFKRLMALSYGMVTYSPNKKAPSINLSKIRNTPALDKRAEWFEYLMSTPLDLALTREGYNRTDAFGRIGNWVARKDGYMLPLIAPVSLPPMWSMKYASHFHYNANTNSVIMRNIGQSFGLGALVLKADEDEILTTANIYNLSKLERLLYKIKVPEWNVHVPDDLKITKETHADQIQRGCEVYAETCAGCHHLPQRKGPKGQLVYRWSKSIEDIGTDINHAVMQAVPHIVDGKPIKFNRTLFGLTKKIKDSYFNLYPNELSVDLLVDWENRSFRGREHFRDPFLGENFENIINRATNYVWLPRDAGDRDPVTAEELETLADYMKVKPFKYGYAVKHLAGIWATAPYLHNGSVPTIMDLITPPSKGKRPEKFLVGCQGYDEEKLGFAHTIPGYKNSGNESAGCQVALDSNYNNIGETTDAHDHVFDVNEKLNAPVVINGVAMNKNNATSIDARMFDKDVRTGLTYLKELRKMGNGNSNRGHEKYVESLNDRRALITFLKVLVPPPEYSWESEPLYDLKVTNWGTKSNGWTPTYSCTVR